MKQLSIYRYEYNYAGIRGIGITADGELVLTQQKEPIPEFDSRTRIIRNEEVPDAFSAPIKLFLDPSTKCPLKCPFCLSDSGIINTKGIDGQEIERLSNQIIDFGILKVKIGGGEPFVYPYFYDLIKKFNSSGRSVSTSTSGITLPNITQENLNILRENRVKVSISLDGGEQYHDKTRCFPGLFKIATSSVKKLRENGIRTELRSTIINTEESYNQIFELDKISRDLGVPIRIRSVKPKGRAEISNLSTLFPDEKYWFFYDSVRKLRNDNPLINLEEVFCYDSSAHYSVFGQKLDCAAGTRSAYINWNGHFSPCGFIDSYFPSETLKGTDIKILWKNGCNFQKIRGYFKSENQHSECSHCAHVNACQGGCPSVRLATKTAIDPRCPIQRKTYSKERS